MYRMAARPDSVLFSDDDLRDAAEDVCFPHSEDQECINELKRGIDEITLESYETSEESMFSGMSCVSSRESSDKPDVPCSPLRTKRAGRLALLDDSFDKENMEIAELFPQQQQLMDAAYDFIGDCYECCNIADDLSTRISNLVGNRDSGSESRRESTHTFTRLDEEVENECFEDVHREVFGTKEPFGLDKCLRPVLCPKPGETVMKHDPVKRMNIYREEWKRQPTPEEQKRLELRWKVREHMLRKDYPTKFPTGGPVVHPKDWSPRPYLD